MLATSEPQGILIVDDNPTNLEVLSEALIHEGFQVAVAIDGESALEQVNYHRPELILLDVMMPGLSGFEVCEILKGDPLTTHIPVVMVTALSDTENRVRGLEAGAEDGGPEGRPHGHRHPVDIRPPAPFRPRRRLPARDHQEGTPEVGRP